MLMEEDRFVAEANAAAKVSAEIAAFAKENQKNKPHEMVRNSQGFSSMDTRSNNTSIFID